MNEHGQSSYVQSNPETQGSPLRKSLGVESTSTNNLEDAYKELEKEIKDIKNRL